ncbi:DUF4192 family protein [Microbacterium sp. GXF7504]
MTSIVKATDPAHFLSLVPRMFGFTPVRSVVVVPFIRGRSAGGMRVDLPPGEHADAVAATVVGMACRVEGADALMIVVYEDADPDDTGSPGHRITAALRTRADACGLGVVDALLVGPTRWASVLDSRTGGEVAGLTATDAPGEPPAGDQRSGADLDPADPAACADTATALRELEHALHLLAGVPTDADDVAAGCRVDPAALTASTLLDDVPLFFEGCIADLSEHPDARHPDVPEPYLHAALIWCLTRPSLRDIGLMTWLGGLDTGDAAVEGQLGWEDGADYPADIASRMWGEGPRPDAERLLAALERCREAAALAAPEHRAGPLAACAWLSWALGRLTHAEQYARRACEDEERHGLATIVLTFVAAGHLPDWAFRR